MKPRDLERLLRSAEGVKVLIERRVDEVDCIDFKSEINIKSPNTKYELRKDGACLATAGTGFLVIGIKESSDGLNRASEIVGVPSSELASVKKFVEDNLGIGIDPPLSTNSREVWAVEIDEIKSVIVAKVRGRVGYPVSVEDKSGAVRFWVREAGKCKPLSALEANQRRRLLDLSSLKILKVIVLALIIFLIYSSITMHFLKQELSEEKLRVSELAIMLLIGPPSSFPEKKVGFHIGKIGVNFIDLNGNTYLFTGRSVDIRFIDHPNMDRVIAMTLEPDVPGTLTGIPIDKLAEIITMRVNVSEITGPPNITGSAQVFVGVGIIVNGRMVSIGISPLDGDSVLSDVRNYDVSRVFEGVPMKYSQNQGQDTAK